MLDEAHVIATLATFTITPDATQRTAIQALVALLNNGHASTQSDARGVYCYGLPGRGKSLVVDTVFELATCAKRRIHFHEFLREINRRLVQAPRTEGDRLATVAQEWLANIELLCFDEFHVHDIADAFLIGRFLDSALQLGTRIVLTSNYAPDNLLPDPEYHERLRPTIEQIQRRFTVIEFAGMRDYRLGNEDVAHPRFFTPLDAITHARLQDLFLQYDTADALQPQPLIIAYRPLPTRAAGTSLLWADFDALCVERRSHLDYLELSERFRGLIVDELHIAMLRESATLQRLIWLVDIFYDRKRALFIASDQPLVASLTALTELDGAHDLSRTLSRLAEMQSPHYQRMLDHTTPGRQPVASLPAAP